MPPTRLPENVRFTDLGAGGLSQLMGLKMGEELGLPVRNASLLIRSMRFMLEKVSLTLTNPNPDPDPNPNPNQVRPRSSHSHSP